MSLSFAFFQCFSLSISPCAHLQKYIYFIYKIYITHHNHHSVWGISDTGVVDHIIDAKSNGYLRWLKLYLRDWENSTSLPLGTTSAIYCTSTLSHLMKSDSVLITEPELPVTDPFLRRIMKKMHSFGVSKSHRGVWNGFRVHQRKTWL